MNKPNLDDASLRSATLRQLARWKNMFDNGTLEYAEIDLEMKRRRNAFLYGNIAAEDIHHASLKMVKKYIEVYGNTNAVGYEQIPFFD